MTEEEWQTCNDPHYALEFLCGEGGPSDRKLRLFACACCERVANLADPGLLPLLQLAQRCADSLASVVDLALCRATARERFEPWGDSDPHYRAGEAVAEAIILAADTDGVSSHEGVYAHYTVGASGMAAVAMEHTQRDDGALFAEFDCQSVFLRDIFGNPFRPVAFDSVWGTSDVTALATGIYGERAFDRLPILADALQDAGCDSADLLNHLRDPNAAHVRGCSALDRVLGKE
ncbi:MAG TPA: hypothetical protein VGE74_14475 [Gemmata sp.]